MLHIPTKIILLDWLLIEYNNSHSAFNDHPLPKVHHGLINYKEIWSSYKEKLNIWAILEKISGADIK